MYKKIIAFLITSVLLALLLIPAYANNDMSKDEELNNEELKKLEAILQDEDRFIITEAVGSAERETLISNYDIDKAKKVFFSEILMLTAYEETSNIDSIFTDRYVWLVPVNGSENEVSIFSENEGEFRLAGISPMIGRYISDEELFASIAQSDIDENSINSIKYLYAPIYHATFAVIYTDSDTYCVPFASNEEFFGLKNLKVYTVENMMKLLIERYDESKLLEDPEGYGGVPLRDHFPWIPVTLCVSAVVIATSSFALIKMRKKKKTTV